MKCICSEAIWDVLPTETTDFPILSYTSSSKTPTLSYIWSLKQVPLLGEAFPYGSFFREYPRGAISWDKIILKGLGSAKSYLFHLKELSRSSNLLFFWNLTLNFFLACFQPGALFGYSLHKEINIIIIIIIIIIDLLLSNAGIIWSYLNQDGPVSRQLKLIKLKPMLDWVCFTIDSCWIVSLDQQN